MPVIIGAKKESGFSDPIGLLGDCHRRIERFLSVLIHVATQARGERLSEEQRASWETALRYFREAAPKHTADEEDSLFPRLRQIARPEVQALLERVDVLEQEHARAAQNHEAIDQLGQTWLKEERLSAEQASRLIALLRELQDLYQRHIALEDAEVFPAAAAVLSDAARRDIGREMAARRGLSPSI
jgi:hemerythrin-like domain-containing protein